MNKVYFDKEKNQWFVNEPEDMYTFKSVNISTNEEINQILSWTRGFDMSNYPNHIRVYDVEIDTIKYFFLMKKENNYYTIESENPMMLEKLINLENIFFVGDTQMNS
jgi:hypothetical protein